MEKVLYDTHQLKAIHSNKNTLLVAGAGAGKTTTILGKIAYLLENGYKEKEILCISFTNASTDDLKQKIGKNIDVYTFHKLAIKILQEYDSHYKLCENNLLERIVDEYILQLFMYKKKKKVFLKYISNISHFKKLTLRFIHLFKANNYDTEKFKDLFLKIKKIKKKEQRKSNFMYLINIVNIYKCYEKEKAASLELDFDDLIIKASKAIKYVNCINQYKYIIIDEFQDSSLVRLQLILEIYNKNNAKVFCVGDDFQSIYQFTGCDLNLFLNFKHYFKKSCIKKLKMTYRNPQELIYVAGHFVMKNKKQLKKNLISLKSIPKPIKIIYNPKILKNIILNLKTNYMILGRNNNDIYTLFSKEDITNHSIIYSTIHKSKGLEADNIIIINLTNDYNSLPSKIKNDYLIDLLLNNHKDIYFEERRIFYVALTRTKNNVYLLTQKHNESTFIKELIKDYKKYIEFIN